MVIMVKKRMVWMLMRRMVRMMRVVRMMKKRMVRMIEIVKEGCGGQIRSGWVALLLTRWK